MNKWMIEHFLYNVQKELRFARKVLKRPFAVFFFKQSYFGYLETTKCRNVTRFWSLFVYKRPNLRLSTSEMARVKRSSYSIVLSVQ